MGPIGCSEMPGKENPYALHNNSEQRRPDLRRGVSLKSRKPLPVFTRFLFRFEQNFLYGDILRKLQREFRKNRRRESCTLFRTVNEFQFGFSTHIFRFEWNFYLSLLIIYELCENRPGKDLLSFVDLINPWPLLFKALLHGQKDRVFLAGI